jgi:hypothetical protein
VPQIIAKIEPNPHKTKILNGITLA